MGLWKDKTRKDWCYSFQYQKEIYAGRGFKTKKDAKAARAKGREKVKNTPLQTGMAFFELCTLYLDFSKKKHVTKSYKGKKWILKDFLKFLGKKKETFLISEITPKLIIKDLDKRPTNKSYNVYRKELSAIFTYARDVLETVDRNPVQKIDKLPHKAKRKTVTI